MMMITSDPNDPRIRRGQADETPVPQNEVYLVLSEEERDQGFVRPLRLNYRHTTCDTVTSMGGAIAATYARDPTFYANTYCVQCAKHRPVAEFRWMDGSVVGS